MKHIIILVVLYIFTNTTHAQNIETPNSRGVIDNIKSVKPAQLNLLPKTNLLFTFNKGNTYEIQNNVVTKGTYLIQTLNGKQYLIPLDGLQSPRKKKAVKQGELIIKDTLPQAKLLNNNDKGKIYALPLDNMRCLVGTINSNMPIATLGPGDYKNIPNAIPEQKIIPEVILPNNGIFHPLSK